jgi:hypothetical protein
VTPNPDTRESEWGACVRCGRQDERGEFVELMGQATPGNPDGGTGDPICPTCIALDEAERRVQELEGALREILSYGRTEPEGATHALIRNRARAALEAARER